MKKTYFLLKDYSNGEPFEMLAFKGICSKKAIQDEINRLDNEFVELMDNDGFVDDQYQSEYVLNHLYDKFPFDLIPWSNDDVVYY